MMESSIKKAGINVDGEESQADDANTVLQDHHEESTDQEQGFLPETPKAEMSDQQCQDNLCHA